MGAHGSAMCPRRRDRETAPEDQAVGKAVPSAGSALPAPMTIEKRCTGAAGADGGIGVREDSKYNERCAGWRMGEGGGGSVPCRQKWSGAHLLPEGFSRLQCGFKGQGTSRNLARTTR